MTLEQSQAHNALHEQFLICGWDWTFTPAEFDDGDPENGPGTWGHDAFYTYSNERWYVHTQYGKVVHQELRNLELEKWLDTEWDASQ